MNYRRALALGLTTLSLGWLVGCGYSEEEWQSKLRENQGLQQQINAEKVAHRKTVDDLNDAQAQIEQLRTQLKKAGVDLSNLNADLAEQRSALEKLRRDKEQLDEIRKRFDLLKHKLETLTKLGLNVTVRNNRMMIQLPGDVLFDSGRIDLKREGKEILIQIAEVIRNDSQLNARDFQVAGHTDNVAFAGGPYKDNWGLSVMRAREVLSFLVAPTDGRQPGGGLAADRWSAAGYGDTDPVASNETVEDRRNNRRVELVVMPSVEEMLDLKSIASGS